MFIIAIYVSSSIDGALQMSIRRSKGKRKNEIFKKLTEMCFKKLFCWCEGQQGNRKKNKNEAKETNDRRGRIGYKRNYLFSVWQLQFVRFSRW